MESTAMILELTQTGHWNTSVGRLRATVPSRLPAVLRRRSEVAQYLKRSRSSSTALAFRRSTSDLTPRRARDGLASRVSTTTPKFIEEYAHEVRKNISEKSVVMW